MGKMTKLVNFIQMISLYVWICLRFFIQIIKILWKCLCIIKKNIQKPLKYGLNIIFLIIYVSLCLLLLLVTSSGFIEIISKFDDPDQGINLFISFIVLSLTLAILAYTVVSKEKTNKQILLKIGANFSISTILFLIGFMGLKGINSEWSLLNHNDFFKLIAILSIAFALLYSVISFFVGLFLLLTVQSGLWIKFEKDIYQARDWFLKFKYQKAIFAICVIIYSLIILGIRYRKVLISIFIP